MRVLFGNSHWKVCSALIRVVIACLAAGIFLGFTAAEEQSLLTNALVSTLYTHTSWTGNRNSVISPGFKSFIHFSIQDPKGDGSYD